MVDLARLTQTETRLIHIITTMVIGVRQKAESVASDLRKKMPKVAADQERIQTKVTGLAENAERH